MPKKIKAVVCWEHKTKDIKGRSNPISVEVAKLWVKKLNKEYRLIHHWYEIKN